MSATPGTKIDLAFSLHNLEHRPSKYLRGDSHLKRRGRKADEGEGVEICNGGRSERGGEGRQR